MISLKGERAIGCNDVLRTAMGLGGRVFQTAGIFALPEQLQSKIHERVETLDDFTEDNDPYDEHGLGSFDLDNHTVLWKIDYYDLDLKHGRENPTDPNVTTHVLTIMLAEEY